MGRILSFRLDPQRPDPPTPAANVLPLPSLRRSTPLQQKVARLERRSAGASAIVEQLVDGILADVTEVGHGA